MQRLRLVHFLDLQTREPLCDGIGQQAATVALNGVFLCEACARRVTDHAGRVVGRPTTLAAWSSSDVHA